MSPHKPENPWENPKPADKTRGKKKSSRKTKKSRSKPKLPMAQPFWHRFIHAFMTDPAPHRTFCILASLLLVMWLATGFYRLEIGDKPVVLHLGDFTQTVSEPGWHYHFPSPFVTVSETDVAIDKGESPIKDVK